MKHFIAAYNLYKNGVIVYQGEHKYQGILIIPDDKLASYIGRNIAFECNDIGEFDIQITHNREISSPEIKDQLENGDLARL